MSKLATDKLNSLVNNFNELMELIDNGDRIDYSRFEVYKKEYEYVFKYKGNNEIVTYLSFLDVVKELIISAHYEELINEKKKFH